MDTGQLAALFRLFAVKLLGDFKRTCCHSASDGVLDPCACSFLSEVRQKLFCISFRRRFGLADSFVNQPMTQIGKVYGMTLNVC